MLRSRASLPISTKPHDCTEASEQSPLAFQKCDPQFVATKEKSFINLLSLVSNAAEREREKRCKVQGKIAGASIATALPAPQGLLPCFFAHTTAHDKTLQSFSS